ncbi:hypothetical protein Q8F55_001236 [Vanrija albida]|uniref:Metallo-beta-lactamase domain-containing protein n=1 Tax=Vanrija albida TaxID=181172 RepID=A0ABR3QG64_9TREE
MNGPGDLVPLPNAARLSAHVTRLLGQNPSLMTLQGTNSYLLQPPSSPAAPAILVDTTSEETAAGWLDLVLARLTTEAGALAPIAHVVLTHRHPDHVGGLPLLLSALKERGAPPPQVWKLPSPDEAELRAGREAAWSDAAIGDTLRALAGAFVPFSDEQPLWPLADGGVVATVDPASGESGAAEARAIADGAPDVPEASRASVRVVHTPGHTADSVSLVLGEGEKGVFTGDTVLGQGTTIFADFGAYMNSLKTLLALDAPVLYPAHGPAIEGRDAAHAHIAEYIKHRQEREDIIVGVIRSLADEPGTLGAKLEALRQARAASASAAGLPPPVAADAEAAAAATDLAPAFPAAGAPGDTAASVSHLCHLVYQSGHPGLLLAASRTMGSHLAKLEAEGKVRKVTAKLPVVSGWTAEPAQDGDAWQWVGGSSRL